MVDLNVKKNSVKKQTCFSQLNDEEIEKLAGLWSVKHFRAGEIIVNEGDTVDSIFIILEGTADVQHITMHNGEIHTETVATLGPGDPIGLNETGFYSLSGLRTATVTAHTDMVVLYLTTAAFHGFALANTHVSEVMRKNSELFKEN